MFHPHKTSLIISHTSEKFESESRHPKKFSTLPSHKNKNLEKLEKSRKSGKINSNDSNETIPYPD
jgi:hypothetical protein